MIYIIGMIIDAAQGHGMEKKNVELALIITLKK
jgi:hypothetical protein